MKENHNTAIYWTLFVHQQWRMYIAATSKGLCYVGSHNKSFEELSQWVMNRIPNRVLLQDDKRLHPYAAELTEYFQGKRKSFAMTSDLYGTSFQLAVWNALREIPYGQTQSYSDIANHIQKPAAVRAVGAAIGANPVLITIPCHRVIGKNGALTGYRGGVEMKKQLLRLECESLLMERSPLHA